MSRQPPNFPPKPNRRAPPALPSAGPPRPPGGVSRGDPTRQNAQPRLPPVPTKSSSRGGSGPPPAPIKSSSRGTRKPPAAPTPAQPPAFSDYSRPVSAASSQGGALRNQPPVFSEQTMQLMEDWDSTASPKVPPNPSGGRRPPPVAARINQWQKASSQPQKPDEYGDFEKERNRGMSRVPRGDAGYGFAARADHQEKFVKQMSNRRSSMHLGGLKTRVSMLDLEDKLDEKTAFGYISDFMCWDCMVACVGCGLAGLHYGMGNTHESFGSMDATWGVFSLMIAAGLLYYRKKYTDRPEPAEMPTRATCMAAAGLLLLPTMATFSAGLLLLITAGVEYMAFKFGESYEYRKPRKDKDAPGIFGRIKAFYKHITSQTNRKKWGFAILWLGISVFIFIERYSFYYYAAQDITSKSFGYDPVWLGVAKGAGTVIDLNACCMLISVCRTFIRNLYNLITLGETSLALCLRSIFQFIPLDKNLQWHKYMAAIVFAMTWLHTAAHLFNYGLVKPLVDYDFGGQIFMTGVSLLILTHIIFCTSFEIVRMNKFEFFWYTHHLFIFYFIINLFHGRDFWGPNFWKYFLFPGTAYTAERILREYRSRQAIGIVSVTHMETKKAKVFALELEKKGALAEFRDGQYAFLKCMAVSEFQWHPFTIASAPEQKTAVFMIRRTGETTWTGRTQDYLKALGPKDKTYHKLEMRAADGTFVPRTIGPDGQQIICVDGPYAAPTQHCVEYYAAIIVGGGIGVTPLRATLQSLVHYKFKNDLGQSYPNYGYFHWGLRWADLPTYSFMFRTFREVQDEWANLTSLQKDIASRKGFEYHLWITKQPDEIPPFKIPDTDEFSRWGPEFESPDARKGAAAGKSIKIFKKCGYTEADFFQAAWSGEECKIGNFFFHRGRPRWDEIFTEVKTLHSGACNKVAVPICGPKALGNSLKQKCAQFSDQTFEFVLHRENF